MTPAAPAGEPDAGPRPGARLLPRLGRNATQRGRAPSRLRARSRPGSARAGHTVGSPSRAGGRESRRGRASRRPGGRRLPRPRRASTRPGLPPLCARPRHPRPRRRPARAPPSGARRQPGRGWRSAPGREGPVELGSSSRNGPGASVRGSTHACNATSLAPRSRASASAKRSAASEAGEPSTPTTMVPIPRLNPSFTRTGDAPAPGVPRLR